MVRTIKLIPFVFILYATLITLPESKLYAQNITIPRDWVEKILLTKDSLTYFQCEVVRKDSVITIQQERLKEKAEKEDSFKREILALEKQNSAYREGMQFIEERYIIINKENKKLRRNLNTCKGIALAGLTTTGLLILLK